MTSLLPKPGGTLPTGTDKKSMRDFLSLFLTLIFLLSGAGLLYDGVSKSDSTQSAKVIAGATILALGLTTMRIVLKEWMDWWKERARYRDG